jgi:hypothetical protein
MFNTGAAQERLTKDLAELYAQNTIRVAEYERILEYINKIETEKEAVIIEKIIHEHGSRDVPAVQSAPETAVPHPGEHNLTPIRQDKPRLAVFSWRSSAIEPVDGDGGAFTSLFGANRIIVDKLPAGRTTLHIHSVFGLTEIVVSKGIRITNRALPFFGGIFMPLSPAEPDNEQGADMPELCISGTAVFGNITIVRI